MLLIRWFSARPSSAATTNYQTSSNRWWRNDFWRRKSGEKKRFSVHKPYWSQWEVRWNWYYQTHDTRLITSAFLRYQKLNFRTHFSDMSWKKAQSSSNQLTQELLCWLMKMITQLWRISRQNYILAPHRIPITHMIVFHGLWKLEKKFSRRQKLWIPHLRLTSFSAR